MSCKAVETVNIFSAIVVYGLKDLAIPCKNTSFFNLFLFFQKEKIRGINMQVVKAAKVTSIHSECLRVFGAIPGSVLHLNKPAH